MEGGRIKDVAVWLKELGICESNSEARRLIKQGGIAINKEKLSPNTKWILFRDETFAFITENEGDEEEGQFMAGVITKASGDKEGIIIKN